MNKYRFNNKGFTLIELIVVVVVLAILAAVAVPMISNYTAKSSATVCLENRGMLLRVFAIHNITDPDDSFATFVTQEYPDQEFCPDHGVYTYQDNHLTCSVHGDGGGGSEPGDGNEEPGGGTEGPGEGIMEFPGGYKAKATGSWADILSQVAPNGNSVGIKKGDIYYAGEDFYVFTGPPGWIADGQSLANQPDAAKVDLTRIIHPEDYAGGAQVYLSPGVARLEEGELYVYIGGYVGNWPYDSVATGGWAKLDRI